MRKKKPPIKRVNLSLPRSTVYLVNLLAERDDVTLTTKAAELLEEGLKAEEDRVLVELAEERLADIEESDVKPLSSKEFWNMVASDSKKRRRL